MQSIVTKACGAALLLALMSCSEKPKAPQGWDVGGGGNAYAAEFKDIGRTVVRRLEQRQVKEVVGVSPASFQSILEKSEVRTTDAVLQRNGMQVDALNFPSEGRIELSLVHWGKSMDFSQKRRLVIHEVLGLMRRDDSDYGLTTQILTASGFFHNVLVDQFRIQGDVAKIIVEKMKWAPDEVQVDEYLPHGRTTWYEVPHQKVVLPLKCMKMEFLTGKQRTSYDCDIAGTAHYTDAGLIYMELMNTEPLLRLFGRSPSETESGVTNRMKGFDYGVVRGEIDGPIAYLVLLP